MVSTARLRRHCGGERGNGRHPAITRLRRARGDAAIVGMYAGALPPILAAIFASSPYLQTGPVAITALLTFGALSTMAPPGSPEYVGLGLALAHWVGR